MWQTLTGPEKEEAQLVARTWISGPTALTTQALDGLARAEAVAGSAGR
jgi:hypothetical protein